MEQENYTVCCENCEHRNGDYCHNYNGFTNGNFIRMDDFCSRWKAKIRRGAWKEISADLYECSVCGQVTNEDEEHLNYCPYCGAQMVETFWKY